jgi:hypothetical protein
MSRVVFARAVLALAMWSTTALAAPRPPPAARDLAKQGYELKLQKQWAAAREKLVESLKLDSQPKTLINLAECEVELGKLVEAEKHLVEARDSTKGDAELNGIAVARLAALERRIPRLTIHVAHVPSGTVVTLDDVVLEKPSFDTALPIEPGPHVVVAKGAGRADQRWDVALVEGEKKTLEVAPSPALEPKEPSKPPVVEPARAADPEPALSPSSSEPPPVPDERRPEDKPTPWRTVGAVTMGVGAVGLGIGAVLGGMAASKKCANNHCASEDQRANHLEGRADADRATVAVIAGGALVGIGGLVLLAAPARRVKGVASIDVGVGLDRVVVRGAW